LAHSRLYRSVTRGFEFHCRESQGAALALTSSGDLETLTSSSKKQLRQYLCVHGTHLMTQLRRKDHLQCGQSLYVVTGTIKSDSWAIAVHTSPMQEPDNRIVLTRRDGPPFPTHEWTSIGRADARCGTAKVNEDGTRRKDQCLFLRGFLLTPSSESEGPSTTNSGSGATGSSPKSTDSESSDECGGKRGPENSGQRGSPESNYRSSSSPHNQLQGMITQVEPFPAPTANSKVGYFTVLLLGSSCDPFLQRHYPSQSINDVLLEDVRFINILLVI
jgi:hypothetical protein